LFPTKFVEKIKIHILCVSRQWSRDVTYRTRRSIEIRPRSHISLGQDRSRFIFHWMDGISRS